VPIAAWILLFVFIGAVIAIALRRPSAPASLPELETYRSATPATSATSKREVFEELLRIRSKVFVNFDPRAPDVTIPQQLRGQPRCVLMYGRNTKIPIPDLRVDHRGISATLSFGGTKEHTYVPWSSVFAILSEDKRGKLWEEDVPPDLET
jgi:hypothetical protein